MSPRSVLGLSPFDDQTVDLPLGSTTAGQRHTARLCAAANVPPADLATVLQALGLMPYLEAPVAKPKRVRHR